MDLYGGVNSRNFIIHHLMRVPRFDVSKERKVNQFDFVLN